MSKKKRLTCRTRVAVCFAVVVVILTYTLTDEVYAQLPGETFSECLTGQQDDDDGITLLENACTPTLNDSIWHDAEGTHDFCRETVAVGCDIATGCLGRCTAGCGLAGSGAGLYTMDCAEHDRCCRVHGGCLNPFDPECGDEWWEAIDDTAFAQFPGNYNCASGCLPLDIIFVIDVTGSMWDDIAAVKAGATNIVNQIASSRGNFRIGLVTYKDFPVLPYGSSGDFPYRTNLGFSADTGAVISAIQALRVGGGADWPESVYSALIHAMSFPWRNGAAKLIIGPLGDAPPHDPEPFTGYTMSSVITAAQAVDPAIIFPIAIGGDSTTYAYFSELAEETGGKVFTAPTASDVVEAITEAIEAALKSPVADANGPYTGTTGSPITFDASGSYDSDGEIVSYEWDWNNDGTYNESTTSPTITHTWSTEYSGIVKLRVTDDEGLTGIDTASVEVINNPPVALCQNITTYADANCQASVSVDNGSYDPDGDSITLNQLPPAPYYLGTSNVTLTVTDDKGASGSCSAIITVLDATPPIIKSITAAPDVLWPPDHRLVPVTLDVLAQDNCDLKPVCKIVSVTSNEPEDDKGDGKTSPDWIVNKDLVVDLRAERSGIGDGRIYTITVSCADVSFNTATGTVNVSVAHDKGKY